MAPTCESQDQKSIRESGDSKMETKRNKDHKAKDFESPLVVAFVGLPARGKTVFAQKLSRYLRWSGMSSKVFSVCDYCRKDAKLLQNNNNDGDNDDDNGVFRSGGQKTVKISEKLATEETVQDVVRWLNDNGEVAIIDDTNSNRSHRQLLFECFVKQLKFKLLFIECVCDDEKTLKRNVREIWQFNLDQKQVKKETALNDFRHKMEHHKDRYECLSRRSEPHLSFIKVMNEGEDISVHRVSGQLESKILYYLSNCRTQPRTLYFSRHGESEFNLIGRIGGDASLSPRGMQYAEMLAKYFNQSSIKDLKIWTSKKRRTNQTVMGIKAPVECLEALNELDAGVCEGMTYEEMQEHYPREFAWRDQDKLRYRYPRGESYKDIMQRLEPVLMQLESSNNVLVVSHQAVLRCILSYFLDKSTDQLPYMEIPLHTIIKITSHGYNYKLELIKLDVDCVDTTRKRPEDCSPWRSSNKALETVPQHY